MTGFSPEAIKQTLRWNEPPGREAIHPNVYYRIEDPTIKEI